MWAARQFAGDFIFGFAAFKKSIPMHTIAYIFFLIMNIGDFLSAYYNMTAHFTQEPELCV
jgi:hypothetical protein